MVLAFLDSAELFTAPWLIPMLAGLIAPAAAIPIARARFGRRAQWRGAVVYLAADVAALVMAVIVRGDNPFPILTVAVAPAGLFIAAVTIARHAKESPSGVCTSCGYDLRATPARCPECGTVPSRT